MRRDATWVNQSCGSTSNQLWLTTQRGTFNGKTPAVQCLCQPAPLIGADLTSPSYPHTFSISTEILRSLCCISHPPSPN